MLTFLRANGRRAAISDEHLAAMMVELQRRAESGEHVRRLVRWIATKLGRRPPRRGKAR
jgi:prophage maintenance system killer protein